MPRIDPSQLLRTLSVLLAKDGGIRSAEEVPRIVQLMQKFSKKLVSKCIYIHILCSSTPELLESFLSQKGWDLLNSWFSDAIKSQNYFLCGDLVKLFAVCPMNSARLKENVEINQAPKLIRQLSCDTRIEKSVRDLALQVLQQWMSVIRTPATSQISNSVAPTVNTNGKSGADSDQVLKVTTPQQQYSAKLATKPKPSPPKKSSPSKEKKRHNVIDSSDSEDNHDGDDSKDYNPSGSDLENGNPTIKKLKKDTSKDDSTDVDDLLGGDSDSEDEKRNKVKEDKSKKDASSMVSEAAIKKKKEERERRDKEREKEREERKRKERERERRKAQERKDKAKPYSRSELRTSLDSADKELIKEVAKKFKEEAGSSTTPSLGRIPKLAKPADKEEKKKASFGDMLGEIDTKKIKKAPPFKNKNRDLLESITNPSPIKPKPKVDSKSAGEMLKKVVKEKKEERRNSFSNMEGEKKLKTDNESKDNAAAKTQEPTEKEKPSERAEKEKPSDRPKPKIIIPEKTAEKRSHKDASPKVETKKSPSVIKESSFFGDVLGDIMKEPPRKKKRRPSDVKPEKEVKEVIEKAKEVSDKESSPEETEENMETADNADDLAFKEPTSELPREVRGILVYVKGNKPKKKIQWRPEDKLVEIEYFEMDETERANVWKMKTFEEMKKKESDMEKMKFQSGFASKANAEEETEEAPKVWRLLVLEFEGEIHEGVTKIWDVQGSQSGEKAVQEQRELRVLRSLYFNQIPSDPSEPDPGSNDKTGEETKEIPPLDLSENKDDSSYDYSQDNWPAPTLQSQPVAAPISTNSITALLKDINPSLLASLPPPNHLPPNIPPPYLPPPSLSSADAKLFAAQKAAAEALAASLPMPTPPPALGGGGVPPHPGYQHQPYQGVDRGGHRGHNNYDRGYKGGHSNYHNNHNYNKNYKVRDGRDNRDEHRDRERDRGYRDKNDYKRPCKFWMERGKCKDGDRCVYPHPSR